MKKQVTLVLIVLVLVLLSASCRKNNSGIDASPTGEMNSASPSEPVSTHFIPAQPLSFDGLEETLDFIRKSDCSSYKPEDQPVYEGMIDVFQKDKAVYEISNNEYDYFNNTVVLFPEQKYEDVGIARYFIDGDTLYQVVVYYVKDGEAYAIDMQAETFKEYYTKRYDVSYAFWQTISTSNPVLNILYVQPFGEEKRSAHCMLDAQHYIVIRTSASDEDLIKFANALMIQRVQLG